MPLTAEAAENLPKATTRNSQDRFQKGEAIKSHFGTDNIIMGFKALQIPRSPINILQASGRASVYFWHLHRKDPVISDQYQQHRETAQLTYCVREFICNCNVLH